MIVDKRQNCSLWLFTQDLANSFGSLFRHGAAGPKVLLSSVGFLQIQSRAVVFRSPVLSACPHGIDYVDRGQTLQRGDPTIWADCLITAAGICGGHPAERSNYQGAFSLVVSVSSTSLCYQVRQDTPCSFLPGVQDLGMRVVQLLVEGTIGHLACPNLPCYQ